MSFLLSYLTNHQSSKMTHTQYVFDFLLNFVSLICNIDSSLECRPKGEVFYPKAKFTESDLSSYMQCTLHYSCKNPSLLYMDKMFLSKSQDPIIEHYMGKHKFHPVH
uniref:Uncharacterized protein n=1 Tax=Cacopsylla melanoneura TaxID=428564 RepID=A0A8D8XEK2_9HEMI